MGFRDVWNRYVRTPIQEIRLRTTVPAGESIREQAGAVTGRDYTQPVKDVPAQPGYVSVTYGGGGGGGYIPPTPTQEITPTTIVEEPKEVHITQQPKDEVVRPGTTTIQVLKPLITPIPFGLAPEIKKTFQSVSELARRTGRKQRTREQKLIDKYKRGEKLTSWERSKLIQLGYIQREKRGFSLTQKYYEAFGVKFYEPGERKKIIETKLKPFKETETFEEQQKAVKQLRASGIPVTKETTPTGEAFVVDVSGIAPTSKWGNIAVGLTDIMGKSVLFGAYLKTGAVKKKQLTQQEQLRLYSKQFEKKEVVEKGEAIIRKVEKVWIKKGASGAEKEAIKLLRQAKTPEARRGAETILRNLQSKGIIREYSFNIQTGEVQFGSFAQSPVIKPTVEVFGRIPTMEKAPEIISVTRSIDKFKPLGVMETKFKTKTIQQPTEKILPVTKGLTKQKPTIKTRMKQAVIPKVSQVLKPTIKLGVAGRVIQKERQALKQPSLLKQTFKTPFGKPMKPTIEKPTFKWPPFIFGKRKRKKPFKPKIKVKMPKVKTEYRPTLGAKWLGLKARIIPKGYKLGLGGVMARGIITSGKKRKKKKKTVKRRKKK